MVDKRRLIKGSSVSSKLLTAYCLLFTVYCLLPTPLLAEEGMVYIPEGEFTMGSRGKLEHGYDGGDGRVGLEVGVDELPLHNVHLKGFFIDRYEVTNAQYKEFIDATGHKVPVDRNLDAPYNWKNGGFPEGEDKHPVVNVTWYDAYAYCEWAGKRLPTEQEWEKACRGTEANRWSFGNRFIPKYTNTVELDLKWSQAVGSFPEDRSPYRVFDMTGNVTEWADSWYNPYPGSILERETFGEKNRVIRGGSWLTDLQVARCTNRTFAIPKKKHRTMGFRCAKDGQ